MKKLILISLVMGLVALLATGCSSKAKDEQIASLQAQLEETRQELATAQDLNQRAEARARQLQEELDSLARLEQMVVELREHFTVLRVQDQLMFSSGQAQLNSNGQRILDQVADVLNRYPEYEIRVEGHTDDKQIKPEFQNRFASNWELSTARATNVVHYLTSQLNFDPKRLSAVGQGEHEPIASNESVDGRSQNRRVEFLISPQMPEKVLGEEVIEDEGEQIIP
jgi:chemotaxis protein MotB